MLLTQTRLPFLAFHASLPTHRACRSFWPADQAGCVKVGWTTRRTSSGQGLHVLARGAAWPYTLIVLTLHARPNGCNASSSAFRTPQVDAGFGAPEGEVWRSDDPFNPTRPFPQPQHFMALAGPNWYPFMALLPKGKARGKCADAYRTCDNDATCV